MMASVTQIFLGKLECVPAETDAETQLFPEKIAFFPVPKHLELAGAGPNKPHIFLTVSFCCLVLVVLGFVFGFLWGFLVWFGFGGGFLLVLFFFFPQENKTLHVKMIAN